MIHGSGKTLMSLNVSKERRNSSLLKVSAAGLLMCVIILSGCVGSHLSRNYPALVGFDGTIVSEPADGSYPVGSAFGMSMCLDPALAVTIGAPLVSGPFGKQERVPVRTGRGQVAIERFVYDARPLEVKLQIHSAADTLLDLERVSLRDKCSGKIVRPRTYSAWWAPTNLRSSSTTVPLAENHEVRNLPPRWIPAGVSTLTLSFEEKWTRLHHYILELGSFSLGKRSIRIPAVNLFEQDMFEIDGREVFFVGDCDEFVPYKSSR